MRRVTLAAVITTLAFSGCATGGGSSTSDVRRDPNLITAEELAEFSTGTAQDAVRRLRPSWLRSRGTISGGGNASLPRVFVDGRDYGSTNSLGDFNVDSVAELEFMSATDATTRYGTGYAGGIIHLRTKRIC